MVLLRYPDVPNRLDGGSMTPTPEDVSTIPPDGFFTLYLLDPAQGRPIQSWSFDSSNTVSIGRLEDNDVVLADPIVSRLHATIKRVNDQWELIALGRHGVLVSDRRVESIELNHEIVFQMGPKGPLLQFINSARVLPIESQINRSTLEIDSAMLEALRFDEEQAAQDVQAITANEGFHQLLERARKLREQRR